MGRVNIEDVDKYKGGEGAGFFGLKNDKDIATVRFCHESMDSIEVANCHQIEIDGKKRKVSCLRSYDESVDVCPLCSAGYPMQLRFFLNVLEYEPSKDGKFSGKYVKKIWERGRSFQKEILGLAARYNPLCDTAFEIERQGKAGDTQTKYGIYPMNYSLDELPITDEDLENDSVFGTVVLEKSAEELEYYLDNGEFPPEERANGVQARPAARQATTPVEAQPARRQVSSQAEETRVSRRRL